MPKEFEHDENSLGFSAGKKGTVGTISHAMLKKYA